MSSISITNLDRFGDVEQKSSSKVTRRSITNRIDSSLDLFAQGLYLLQQDRKEKTTKKRLWTTVGLSAFERVSTEKIIILNHCQKPMM